jgi:ketosteroid isomerase-like protein
MRQLPIVASTVLLALSLGCQAPVDHTAEASALLERDRAWAQAAEAGTNADSVLQFWTDDAQVLMPGQPVIVGKEALRQMVTASFATPGFHLSWVPDSAVVSVRGDLGYSYGTNSVAVPDSTGRVITQVGRYVAVWRKDSDGQWRCVIDIYNVGPVGSPS